jgi:inorganic triphosphatase YgiF
MNATEREIELKLEFDPADARRLRRCLSLQSRSSKAVRQRLVSVYFDTADLRLRRSGLSLRVRRNGRTHTQTIKNDDGQAAVVFDRAEWEQEIPGPLPDLAAAKERIEPLLNGQTMDSLRPAFETRIERTKYSLVTRGSRVEVVLDQGEIDTGKRQLPICELEFELKRGEREHLFHLARTLGEAAPLRLSVRSKADRGYELVSNKLNAAEKAADVHVQATMSTAEAFRTIARDCLKQLLANESSMLSGASEPLHQMRIALRRLRAALSTFSIVMADGAYGRIKSDLRWISAELSPARDLDVLVAEVLTPLRQQHPADPGVAVIWRNVQARRARAHKSAAAAVRSARFRALVLDATEWIEAGPWTKDPDDLLRLRREQPIAILAAQELGRRRKQIRKHNTALRGLSVPERHKLRIRVKKLRYAVEFFADVFSGSGAAERCQAMVSALKDLQDALGALNDIAMRERLASRLAVSGRQSKPREAERAFAAGVIFGSQEAHVDQMLEAAAAAHARFLEVKRFWK